MTQALVPFQQTGELVPVVDEAKSFGIIEGEIRDPKALAKPTPQTQKRWLDLGGGRGFFYVKIGYVTERLIEAFGPEWFFDIERTWSAPPDEKGQIEVIVEGRLYAPGIPKWGIRGIGGSKYLPQNAKAMYSTAIASAESIALKNAAKKLGIGIDVNEDEKEGAVIEAKQQTIGTLAETLTKRGKGEAVAALMIQEASQAFNPETGNLDVYNISEDQIDPLTKALLRLVNEQTIKG